MNILHIAPINMQAANGLRFSVPGLATAQNKLLNINVALLNIESYDKIDEDEITKYQFRFWGKYKNVKKLEYPFNNPDIVVFHGVYFLAYIKIYFYLKKNSIPYIIVPRVSLTKGAQKQNSIKKKIGNTLFFKKFIMEASRIHFLTKKEKQLSQKFLNDNFVVGNGVNLPILRKTKTKKKNNCINITFIGRYDLNHKGLDKLVQAIIEIREELLEKNVKINFYGSDFRKGKSYIKKQIELNHIEEILEINEAIYGKEKKQAFFDTTIFITTSRFEGHPMAVIEAMSYGIPCILTPGTNMTEELLNYNAGWTTKFEVENISKTILESISDKDKIFDKGLNARRLVVENYTWDKVASETVDFYSNIVSPTKVD